MIQYDDTTNESPEYAAFVEKFKPKKTTDDCYTPDNIYEAIKTWAVREFDLEGREVLRPFWPGNDYKSTEYPEGCVVIDNPPFSILSEICRWYDERKIAYFLFAPSLTLFSTNRGQSNYVICDVDIVYQNGANVRTGFVTNLGKYAVTLASDLHKTVKDLNERNRNTGKLPAYTYPRNLISSATLQKYVHAGVNMRIPREEVYFVRSLEAQKAAGKAVFGAAFLVSDRAADELEAKAIEAKSAAIKADDPPPMVWPLSEREREIIAGLKP